MRSASCKYDKGAILEALEPRLLLSGTIAGQLWHDLNADGVMDAGELGLDGWTVELTNLTFGGSDTTATSGGGLYSFDDLLPGDYEVRQVDQAGWQQTLPGQPAYHYVQLIDEALGIDFGNVHAGSVSGMKFDDLDGDGVRDPGEPGLNGWTIELVYVATQEVVATTVTALGTQDGQYSFVSVIPGDYEIREVEQAGWVRTSPAHVLTVAGGDEFTDVDFGNSQSALASGQKFNDLNANGLRDPGEPGLDGWTIELVDNQSGLVVDTTVTASIDLDSSGDIDPETESGLYTFSLLNPTPAAEPPALQMMENNAWPGAYFNFDWTDTTMSVNSYSNKNKRCPKPDSTSHWVFEDMPYTEYEIWVCWGHAATKAPAENVPYRVYSGGEIISFAYANGVLVEEFIVDQTSLPSDMFADGVWWRRLGSYHLGGRFAVEIQGPQDVPQGQSHHSFADAVRVEGVPSNYTIRETGQPGWTQSYPELPEHSVHMARENMVSGRDFGNYRLASVSGLKFNDLDGDGAQDPGEQGLDNWTIELVDTSTQQVVASDITSGGGLYSFDDVWPGDYEVREQFQDGWRRTYPQADAHLLTLNSGDSIEDVDFGNVQLASISGVKFEDLDSDGVRDVGEQGLAGWVVELFDADTDVLLDTQVTDAGGAYGFTNVEPGNYEISEVQQTGWIRTLPVDPAYALSLNFGDIVDDVDFGNHPMPSTIFGQKFEDLNANGDKDAGEPGLDGWTIELVETQSDQVVATTVTTSIDLDDDGEIDPEAEAGLYSFVGPYHGSYYIREVPQSPWMQSDSAMGDEFAVHPWGQSPVAATNGQDDTLIAWYSEYARLYDAQGLPRGEAFPTIHANAAAMDGAGDFILTGAPTQGDGSGFGVIAAMYNSDGTPKGDSFIVNTYRSGYQAYPSVATNSNGDFVIVWVSADQDGSDLGVFGQLYHPDGSPKGSEFQVNTTTNYDQRDPVVAMSDSGEFVVVWASEEGPTHNHKDILGQRYAADGTRIGGEFQINTYDYKVQENPAIAMRSSGQFVIAWHSSELDGNGFGIAARRYAEDGLPVGDEFRVNTYAADTQARPDIDIDSSGAFVVSWESRDQDGDQWGVFAQRYSPLGNPLGPEFRVHSSYVGEQAQPTIAMDDSGHFTVAWKSRIPGVSEKVFARRFRSWAVDGAYYLDIQVDQVLDGLDFGNYRPVSVSGLKFHDINGDGVRGAGELGLDDWTIELVDSATGSVVDTCVTVVGGTYLFAGVAPGDYEVREVAQGGWIPTHPHSGEYSLVLQSGDVVEGVDFGNSELGSISGEKFEDIDGDGLRDVGEPGLNGWTIELVSVADGQVLGTRITSGGGSYSFDGLPAGDYEVRDVGQVGWGRTYPAAGTHPATLLSGDVISGVDFGAAELVSITGQKFADLNLNGVRDAGEVGLSGWTIELVDRDTGQVIATTVTSDQDLDLSGDIDFETERGLYEFTDLLPGDYKTREVLQPDWTPTLPVRDGDEFGVNTEVSGDQDSPVVAVADSDRSIVVWQSAAQDGSGDGIYAQLLGADGAPDGPEFLVNATSAGNQSDPAVAVDAAGVFTIVWTDDTLDGAGKGVFARMFGPDGAPLTGEIPVNSYVTGDQSGPTVAANPDGGFVVAWTGAGQDGELGGVFARRFTSAGLPATGEFPVNSTTAGAQQHPAIAVDADGVITIAWDSFGSDGDGYGVYARRFDPAGSPLTAEIPVNTEIASHQLFPSITANAAGRFAVAWNSYNQDGDGYGIYAQRYDSDGSPDGAEFRVNTEIAASQSAPSLAMDAAGNLAIVWASNAQDGDGLGIYAQLYDSAGGSVGAEFPVNAHTAGQQVTPAAAISPAGRLTLAWASSDQDSSGYGVYARQYAAFDSHAYLVTLLSGQDVADMDFGNYAGFGSIQGRKFNDLDINRQRDVGEPGMNNWTIELVDMASGQVMQTAVTQSIDLNGDTTIDPETETGLYVFSGLLPGDYRVREIQQIGWAQVYPDNDNESHSIILGALETVIDVDFGNILAPAVQVIASSVQEGDDLSGMTFTYTAQFNRELRTADLDASDFTLVDGVGTHVSPSLWSYDASTSTLTLEYSSLRDGEYTLTLISGDRAIEDIYRSDLDGETLAWPIPANTSGDGVPGGDFVVNFLWSQEFFDFPTPLRRVDPLGSLIHEGHGQADISRVGQTDTFNIVLDAGQSLSLLVTPDSGLQLSVEAFDAGWNSLASASASTPGQQVLVQNVPIDGSGAYRFAVTGLGATTGDYDIRLLLNSGIEDESAGGGSNDTLATAQDLDGGFIALGGKGTRGAVVSPGGDALGDWYSFSMDAPEPASIVLTQLTVGDTIPDGGFGLELYDSGGSLLASGAAGDSNVDLRIDGLTPGPVGVYFLRVAAAVETAYSLVVTRGAIFDSEPGNNTPGGAQDITDAGAALGYVSAGLLDRLFAYDPDTNTILELDPSDGTLLNTLPSPIAIDPDWDPMVDHVGLAVTETSLLLAASGSEELFELDPNTGQVIRILTVSPDVAGDMAYADGRIFLTAGSELLLGESYSFRTDTGGRVYYEPMAAGPFVVKLSDAQYQAARADGWLYGANSFPRGDYEDGSENGANPYWLCYEDHGNDWEYSDVVVKVTTLANGTTLLDVSSGPVGHDNSIVNAADETLLEIPSRADNLLLELSPDIPPGILAYDYISGDFIGKFNNDQQEAGLAYDGRDLLAVSDGELYSMNPRTGQAELGGPLPGVREWCTGIGVLDGELFVSSVDLDFAAASTGVYNPDTLIWQRSAGASASAALGADETDICDYYRLDAEALEAISIRTATPGDGPGEFASLLDPMLELFDPTGTLVAFDNNSLDGRHALLSHTAQMDGQYVLKVTSVSGRGEYVILLGGDYALDVELRVVDGLYGDDHMADGDFASYNSMSEISLGSTYYAEVWLRDIDTGRGVTSGTVDISYSTEYADVVSLGNGGVFNVMTSGTIYESEGLIDNLGGAALSIGEGTAQWVRLGWVQMLSTAQGEASFALGHDFQPSPPGLANAQFETMPVIADSFALLEYERPSDRYPLDTIGEAPSYKSRRGRDSQGAYTEFLMQDDEGTGGQYAQMDFNGWVDSDGGCRIYDLGLIQIWENIEEETAGSTPDWSGAHGIGYPTGINTNQDLNRIWYKGEPSLQGNGRMQDAIGQSFLLGWDDPKLNWGLVYWTGTPTSVSVHAAPGVVSRRQVFYNNSSRDGYDPGAGPADDNAIDTSKRLLLAGQLIGPAHYSGYLRGINGIMLDIYDVPGTPSAGDFAVRVNQAAELSAWSTGPAPAVSIRPEAGVGGSDRVTLIWPDGLIANRWVEVTVKSDANGGALGLLSDDVFYFGNSIADCDGDGTVGDGDLDLLIDEFGLSGAGLAADFDGDAQVTLGDFVIMRQRFGESVAFPLLPSPTPPAAPSPASSAFGSELIPPGLVSSLNQSPLSESSANTPAANPIVIAVDQPALPSASAPTPPAPPVERELIGVLSDAPPASDGDDLLVDLLAETIGSPLLVAN